VCCCHAVVIADVDQVSSYFAVSCRIAVSIIIAHSHVRLCCRSLVQLLVWQQLPLNWPTDFRHGQIYTNAREKMVRANDRNAKSNDSIFDCSVDFNVKSDVGANR
jgi:hypothetical protein